ncbi:galactitol-1-phosphate 5-dehydrogenase [Granulicella sp. WH15]|uniref:galactitol-1-phosphate 5-dehydrogenase n=1 Tax=Granulicella sp. WH15 TaxID=2602070 RepID=UPI0013677CDD|nr:galactitol-1-phosphate 5-dehydrogenase [Granulicella sp. WH15]QHN03283.1 galactitol-1-phosphate 5-dehydrogenase [Granulicella sp. WH15]
MKAMLLSEYNHLELTDLPKPAPAADELLIEVAACGICGSDVHGYDGSTGRRIPPIVMGHEAAGVVAALGSEVSGFAVGDRVTFDSTVFCGHCEYCLRGQINLCNNRQVLGVSCGEYRRYGAFAEYLTVPARISCHLPDNFSFPEAAMLEAVSVALHGVAVSEMIGEESVLVIGAGMIGLLLLQSARAAGAAKVYIADVDPTRLKLATDLGTDEAIEASGAALTEKILSLTNGRGVDIVLEAVGVDATISTAVDCVRKGGTVTLVGNVSPTVTLPLQKVVSRQIRMQGSCASSGEYGQAIDLIANGKIKVAPLITAVAPLNDGPSWFDRLHAREPNLMKIVLDPRPHAEVQQ